MHCIKKLAASVLLQYDDGQASRGLIGENFRLELMPSCMIFSIDLSNNLESRNRDLHCYRAAQLFQERHDRLRYFHVGDHGLARMLGGVIKSFETEWRLELYAGGPFFYGTKLEVTSGGAGFTVDRMMARKTPPYSMWDLIPAGAPAPYNSK